MVNANIDIFEMSYEESVSYFKRLENGPNASSLSVDNKKIIYVTISVGKLSKYHKGSNMCCHYCDKNNHNMADCRAITKFKQQKKNKAFFEAKAGPEKKSLAFLFKGVNILKRQLKSENTASSKKRKPESIFSTKINLPTSSDEGEKKEYLFTSSKTFSSSKTKLAKSPHTTTNHLIGSD
jgi:hypothetical protein